MPSQTTRRVNSRNRRTFDPSVPGKVTPAVIDSIAATAADTIQITFATRVQPSKMPGYTSGVGGAETVASMTAISDTVIELTFTGDVQGGDMTVKENDPGIRTITGGFVPAGTYAIPVFP